MTDAAPGNIVSGTLQGTIPLPTASLTATVRAMVEATAEAVHPGTLTAADVRMIVAQVVQAQPRRDWRTDVALVVAILGVIVAWLAYQQDRTEYARTGAPPSVTVIVERPDAGEIARIVDERLREREQQADQTVPTAEPDDDLGSHPQERRGTDR